MTSQRLSIQSVAPYLLPFGRNMKEFFFKVTPKLPRPITTNRCQIEQNFGLRDIGKSWVGFRSVQIPTRIQSRNPKIGDPKTPPLHYGQNFELMGVVNYSVYRSRIGMYGRHFDWYHFQRPRCTLTPNMEGSNWGVITWHWNCSQTAADSAKLCIERYLVVVGGLTIGANPNPLPLT